MTYKYDVFVSFRGDVRNNFVDHLYSALSKNYIAIFRDDTKLNKGEAIEPQLLHAIEGSRVMIVVFSKNYASSTWCLRELAKIVDCLNLSTKENRVLPIFYDVEPSDVRKQSGNYEKAFDEHEERFKGNIQMMVQIQKWKEALTQVANISGWNLQNKPQEEEIKQIVEEVTSILRWNSSLPNDLDGVHSTLEQQLKHMSLGSHEIVRNVRICEMNVMEINSHSKVLYHGSLGRTCQGPPHDVGANRTSDQRSHSHSRSHSRGRSRSYSRSCSRSRIHSRSGSRSRGGSRSHGRSCNRNRSCSRGRSCNRSRSRSRERSSNRSRSRGRSCNRSRSRERSCNRSRSRECNRNRSRNRGRSCNRSSSRGRSCNRSHSRGGSRRRNLKTERGEISNEKRSLSGKEI